LSTFSKSSDSNEHGKNGNYMSILTLSLSWLCLASTIMSLKICGDMNDEIALNERIASKDIETTEMQAPETVPSAYYPGATR
jgi:hypothetical protein